MGGEGFEKIGHLENIDFDAQGRVKTETFMTRNLPLFFIIYAPWCGHCKVAAPEFVRLAQQVHNQKVFIACLNGADESSEAKALMQRLPGILGKDGIRFQGFPTLILYKDGKYIEYKGARKAEAMKQYLDHL